MFRWVWSDNPHDWVAWLTLVVGSLIAAIAARIAHSQTKLQRAQLKHQLYDRRLQVYLGLTNLVFHVFQHANVSSEAFGQFVASTHFADFLFEPDISEYLREVRNKALRLKTLTALEAAEKESNRATGRESFSSERIQNREEASNLVTWFADEAALLTTRFEPYFRISE